MVKLKFASVDEMRETFAFIGQIMSNCLSLTSNVTCSDNGCDAEDEAQEETPAPAPVSVPTAEKPQRKRRTKAEIAADAAKEAETKEVPVADAKEVLKLQRKRTHLARQLRKPMWS